MPPYSPPALLDMMVDVRGVTAGRRGQEQSCIERTVGASTFVYGAPKTTSAFRSRLEEFT